MLHHFFELHIFELLAHSIAASSRCKFFQFSLWSNMEIIQFCRHVIRMSHWRNMMVDGSELWIIYQQLMLLRKASHWNSIQNLAPSCGVNVTSELCLLMSHFFVSKKDCVAQEPYNLSYYQSNCNIIKNKFSLRFSQHESMYLKKAYVAQGHASRGP